MKSIIFDKRTDFDSYGIFYTPVCGVITENEVSKITVDKDKQ
jgi:hypothetical protein